MGFAIIIKFIYLFSFWLRCIFVAAQTFSSCGEWGLLLVTVRRLLIAVASRCRAQTLGTWLQQLWLMGSGARTQYLCHMGLVAPWHVESSWTRDQTHGSFLQIPIHCTPRGISVCSSCDHVFPIGLLDGCENYWDSVSKKTQHSAYHTID